MKEIQGVNGGDSECELRFRDEWTKFIKSYFQSIYVQTKYLGEAVCKSQAGGTAATGRWGQVAVAVSSNDYSVGLQSGVRWIGEILHVEGVAVRRCCLIMLRREPFTQSSFTDCTRHL